MDKPWLVVGDFNDYASQGERRNFTPSQSSAKTQNFLERINNCNLIDLGSSGPKITWTSNRQEKVHSASNYVKFETPNKPDFVLAFLENHGFSKTQISNLARKYPPVILCDLEKTLLTKFWFFKSKSVSSTDVAKILSLAPAVLKRSMENQIIPPFNFFKSFVQSEEETIPAIKRNADLLLVDLQACALPNVKILREANVPDAKILFMLKFKAGAFNSTSDRFRKIVNKNFNRAWKNPLQTPP
ncbi:hypothetical protein ACSBR2_022760 [Camellia fascicularis]